MGRPYADELERLSDTYDWALALSVDRLASAIRKITTLPLVAVGSGGSFTSAELAAAAHREYCSVSAVAATPLAAVATPHTLRSSAVMLLTAGGGNPDVLRSFSRLVEREPRRLIALCARAGSPLATQAAKHPFVDLTDFDVPSGKDGFLATNSLLGSAVVLVRAYSSAYGRAQPLPKDLRSLLGEELGTRPAEELDRRCQSLWKRQALMVLYGPATHAAAVDLESKFTEAALGPALIADYRNFAHGRHHWLAKRGEQTGVLAFVTDMDRAVANATLDLIPRRIPVVRLAVPGRGVAACLSAVGQVLMVVGSVGKARGLDPGDPGVPSFGRRIYHLRTFEQPTPRETGGSMLEAAAIERKSGVSLDSLLSQERLGAWRKAYREFCATITTTKYDGLVLDYDGTLCDEALRYGSLPAAISKQLNRILRAGTILGVATGRGKSVKEALRAAIDTRLWNRVIVGYYNGGDIGRLSEEEHPDGTDAVGPALIQVAGAIRAERRLSKLAQLTFRLPQITVEPNAQVAADEVWEMLQLLLARLEVPGVYVVRSSHSMDIVAPGVSKLAVIACVRQALEGDLSMPVLCIGDRGRWPGNDFALLSGPHSLSVDEVSPDPRSCWNLAAPGSRGVAATIGYLNNLKASASGLRLRIE